MIECTFLQIFSVPVQPLTVLVRNTHRSLQLTYTIWIYLSVQRFRNTYRNFAGEFACKLCRETPATSNIDQALTKCFLSMVQIHL